MPQKCYIREAARKCSLKPLVTMKLMTEVTQYIRNNKLLVLLDFLLIALFFSPYSVTRETSWVDGTEMWQNNPVYSDEFMLICFVPLLILTLIYQVFKETLLGKVSLIFALIIGATYSLNALFASPFLDAQDCKPHVGTYILILVFPVQLLILRKNGSLNVET